MQRCVYANRDDLFRNYPELEPDDVQQALAFAAANLEDSAADRLTEAITVRLVLDQGVPRDATVNGQEGKLQRRAEAD
jgi:hypothetical protein